MARLNPVGLADKYTQAGGEVFLSGMQALVRLCLLQAGFDRLAGRRTAGFVSGYRGSPVGGLDREMQRAARWLGEAGIHFEPGLNEDLAATACWGTQQTGLFPGARVEGVFALWYGKNPGLDRSMDAVRHATHWGTSHVGGVLAVVGDDHLAKSSAFGHQSEYAFADCLMPVLAPADISEILTLGLFGWALSRHCGAWTGFKLAGSICEGSATVRLPEQLPWTLPADFQSPLADVHIRWPDDPAAIEHRARELKLPAAQTLARAAGVDRVLGAIGGPARLGIVAPGRAWGELREALSQLGIRDSDLADVGIRLLKPALVWPLVPETVQAFCRDVELVLVAEDKRPLVEDQLKVLMYGQRSQRPVPIIGKTDVEGRRLLPETGEVNAIDLGLIIARTLALPEARTAPLLARRDAAKSSRPAEVRTPFFCAGCPHNTSTRIPEGSLAIGGIGCHTLAMGMDRGARTFSHMGGEGATWLGISPFSDLPHVFQNMGDGTYQHSGSMGIRAAVAAGRNITFKLLFNDAVAMTGGQAIEGNLTVPRLTRQLSAEGVQAIAVVTDEPEKYGAMDEPLCNEATVHHRDQLDRVQRRLRETPGVTVLIYDQTCAAEKRRRRKRGTYPDPPRHVVINELVCEGCGDCSQQSNCLAVTPRPTPFGMRRQIDLDACNKDFSCLKGFCPSFVTIEGGRRRSRSTTTPPAAPDIAPIDVSQQPYSLLLAGIGGTGIVTLGALIGTAARMEGKASVINDVTGMAQKGGPVLGHVQVAETAEMIRAERIPPGSANVVLAADPLVATMPDAFSRIGHHTRILAGSEVLPTGDFTRDPDANIDPAGLLERLRTRANAVEAVPAIAITTHLQGSGVCAGVLLLGMLSQRGLLPVGAEALREAIRLNGVSVERNLGAFEWGRSLAADSEQLALMCRETGSTIPLDAFIAERAGFLESYQDRHWADRFRALTERARNAERHIAPGREALTRAVAQSAFRLMAYKDEYEVARLHTDPAFRARIAEQFEGDYRLQWHLSPPLIAPLDPDTGRPRKLRFGPWVERLFSLLARLRRIRGRWYDPFGYTRERRTERRLIEDYFSDVDRLLDQLTLERIDEATQLAALPQRIRGYGPVKLQMIAEYTAARREAWDRWTRLNAS